jgi:hypothetical protein
MDPASSVRLDALRGEILLGRTGVPVSEEGPEGALRVGGPAGPLLRPLTFGERGRVAAQAAASARPRDNLCAAVLRLATLAAGSGDRLVHEIVALFLAGAALQDAPLFSEAALLVVRASGWDPQQLAAAQAVEVDRLAVHLHGRGHAPGWTRIQLAGSPAQELGQIRDELTGNLLARAEVGPGTLVGGPGRPEQASTGAGQQSGSGRRDYAAADPGFSLREPWEPEMPSGSPVPGQPALLQGTPPEAVPAVPAGGNGPPAEARAGAPWSDGPAANPAGSRGGSPPALTRTRRPPDPDPAGAAGAALEAVAAAWFSPVMAPGGVGRSLGGQLPAVGQPVAGPTAPWPAAGPEETRSLSFAPGGTSPGSVLEEPGRTTAPAAWGRWPSPGEAREAGSDRGLDDLLDAIGGALHLEADLRGLER